MNVICSKIVTAIISLVYTYLHAWIVFFFLFVLLVRVVSLPYVVISCAKNILTLCVSEYMENLLYYPQRIRGRASKSNLDKEIKSRRRVVVKEYEKICKKRNLFLFGKIEQKIFFLSVRKCLRYEKRSTQKGKRILHIFDTKYCSATENTCRSISSKYKR